MNRLKHKAAPMSNHQGLFESKALKSLPTDTVDMVFRCSRVMVKQSMNMTKQAAEMTTIAQNHPPGVLYPPIRLVKGSHRNNEMKEPP